MSKKEFITQLSEVALTQRPENKFFGNNTADGTPTIAAQTMAIKGPITATKDSGFSADIVADGRKYIVGRQRTDHEKFTMGKHGNVQHPPASK